MIAPRSVDELQEAVRAARARGVPLGPVDLRQLNRTIFHQPEDLTARVETGQTLGSLQQALAKSGQWLPSDPPHPGRLSIAGLLDNNPFGPRRFGFGTIREHLIGMTAVMGTGELVSAGGNVVKNVAGYDLCKLMVGSRGTLGLVVEAAFKLLPLAETEAFAAKAIPGPGPLPELFDEVQQAPFKPVVLDLFRLEASAAAPLTVVLGFAGTSAEVAHQMELAGGMGFQPRAAPDYDEALLAAAESRDVRRISVLPTAVPETLETLGPVAFVCQLGNGTIHYLGGPAPAKSELPAQLMQRIKKTFDPDNILPPLPW